MKSQAERKETPMNRLRDPPRSATNEMPEKSQTSFSDLISREAKVYEKRKLLR